MFRWTRHDHIGEHEMDERVQLQGEIAEEVEGSGPHGAKKSTTRRKAGRLTGQVNAIHLISLFLLVPKCN